MSAVGARRARPEDVQRSLRLAFRGEVERRLPHLLTPDDPELARHDAHALASSAWVVGEPELSRLAREVEQDPTPERLQALAAALEEWVL